jgi:putative alpha-1,2-mannosidase
MKIKKRQLKLLITESLKIQFSNSASEEDKQVMMQGLYQMFGIDNKSLQEKKKVDYKKAYKKYHSSKKAKKERAQRNAAGRKLKKAGVKIPDGYEIDHKKAISDGGSNDDSNLEVISRLKNRRKGQKITTKKRKNSGSY